MTTGLIASAAKSSQLPTPARPEYLIMGRSNSGKSSLINHLANQRNLARESSTPGRTQLAHLFRLNLVGKTTDLIDLPGYGFAKVPDNVRRDWQGLVEGCLRRQPLRGGILIIDVRRELQDDDTGVAEMVLGAKTPLILVLTKSDKVGANELTKLVQGWQKIAAHIGAAEIFCVSNLNGKGMDPLRQFLAKS
jgi:GTP-binding protein